ncbi:MAG: hypothetical protein ACLQMO_14715 [Acidobacteriaceae bacterium]
MNDKGRTRKINEPFNSHADYVSQLLIYLSLSNQPCDVIFYNRPPILDVRVPENIALALMYGAGAEKLRELLGSITFSDGSSANFDEIWIIYPMPNGGISEETLASVDLCDGDCAAGANGETVRKIITDTYHCESKEQQDFYLRRFLAS